MRVNKINQIPKNTPYCYSSRGEFDFKTLELKGYQECPYFTYKKTDYGFKNRGTQKQMCEYCKFLHKYLSVQDQVKDCGISLGI